MGKRTHTHNTLDYTRNPTPDPNAAPTELFKTLYWGALSLLANPTAPLPSPTVQDLTNVLDKVAKERFYRNYGYTFQGAVSKPTTPDIRSLSSLEAFLNISNASDNQILAYVNWLLHGQLDIASKSRPVSETAHAHLVEQGRLLTRAPIDNNWAVSPFNKSYSDPEPGKNPWKAELLMVQCNAGLTINGHSARYTLIYFIGVYFEIISPDALQIRLFKTLQTNANILSGGGIDTSSPNLSTLQGSLLKANSADFLQHYGIPFKGHYTRPRDLITSKSDSVRGTSAIHYIQGEDKPDLKTFIERSILGAIDLPRQDIRFAAEKIHSSLSDQLTKLLKDNTGTSWLQVAFTQTYDSSALGANSVRTISTIAYTNASIKDGSTILKMTFISYMGVYFHVASPLQSAVDALLSRLLEKASNLFNPPKVFPQPHDTQRLIGFLKEYSESQFENFYDFKYEGAKTKPPDMVPPTGEDVPVLTSNATVVVIPDNEWDRLSIKIETQIMSGLDLPEWVSEPALLHLKAAFRSTKDVSSDDAWMSSSHTRRYKNTISSEGFRWKTCAILTFCHSSLTEGDITVTRTFISYVGIFYPVRGILRTARIIEQAEEEEEDDDDDDEGGQFVLL